MFSDPTVKHLLVCGSKFSKPYDNRMHKGLMVFVSEATSG